MPMYAKNVYLCDKKNITTMKRLLLALLTAVCISSTYAQVKMPVLRVSFDGKFSSKMTEYLNGTMQLTDETGNVTQLNAKFKTRGATAKNYSMKPSFNMKLRNEDYSESQDSMLLGMRSCSSWILDAMAIDRICMRNRVVFDVWNEYGRLPYETSFDSRNGTIGRFVEVYINDQYHGIYCMNDRVNRKLLDLKKVKENEDGSITTRGVLYKHGTSDIANQNERNFNEDYSAATLSWHNAWELAEPDDYPSYEAWLPLLDAYDNGKNAAYIKKYFYLENLAQYQILVMAFSASDNWGEKNRYLSIRNIQKDIDDPDPSEAARRKFVLTPWDLDTSLGGEYNGSRYDGNYTDWKIADVAKKGVYPFSNCMADPEYKAVLKACWTEQRTAALSVQNVAGKLRAYRDLFLQSGAWERMTTYYDMQKNKPCYVEDLTKEIELIIAWYAARYTEMDKYFGIEETDAISEVEMATTEAGTAAPEAVYDLTGKPVAGTELKPSVYLKSGRKYVVR